MLISYSSMEWGCKSVWKESDNNELWESVLLHLTPSSMFHRSALRVLATARRSWNSRRNLDQPPVWVTQNAPSRPCWGICPRATQLEELQAGKQSCSSLLLGQETSPKLKKGTFLLLRNGRGVEVQRKSPRGYQWVYLWMGKSSATVTQTETVESRERWGSQYCLACFSPVKKPQTGEHLTQDTDKPEWGSGGKKRRHLQYITSSSCLNNLMMHSGAPAPGLIEVWILEKVWTQSDKMTLNEPGNTSLLWAKWCFWLNIRLKYVPLLWPAIIPPSPPQGNCCNLQKKLKTLWKLRGDLFSGGAKSLKFLLKDDEPEKNCSKKLDAEWWFLKKIRHLEPSALQ